MYSDQKGKQGRRVARRKMATSDADTTLAFPRRARPFQDLESLVLVAARARDVARTQLVTCAETATVQEAARLMSANRTSSVVVVDQAGRAVGIVTDWDLRERVVSVGRDARIPVTTIMSSPPVSIKIDEAAMEAVRLMIGRNIHHLVVVEEGCPVGMITGHDLIVLQGTSALFVAREIDRQTDLAGLRRAQEQAQRVIPFLLAQGLQGGQLCRIVAEINDRLVTRVLQLTEAALGPPPAPYCWLVLGSEGRREQTFKTDQDNALVYADPPHELADATREYFVEFSRRVVAGLVEVGFPPCPGHYTADNPDWTQPLSRWRERFHHWVAIPEPEAVLNSLIFFDFRGIFGDLSLADQLRAYVARLMGQSRLFLIHLANLSTAQSPPIGFLGHFVVERRGEHAKELDLKFKGAARVVDLARFFALQNGIGETSTLGRLELLKDGHHLAVDLAEELSQAFQFIMNLRVQHQWAQMQAGKKCSNFIDPKQLSPLDRSALREAFQVIARAQAAVREEYHAARIAE
ncbi:MAG: DUF294 nucleotidyltransferase-like domain-containing protein [Dehalococcoidales bacterium]|nr:DUF294 nucleotidyltransferase-like domain-containing protein [Dehalococcoidales bacterium]